MDRTIGVNPVRVSGARGLPTETALDNLNANMPRWTGHPKKALSPKKLAYMRAYNREYRKRLRGGRPSMPHVMRGILGMAAMRANQRKRELEAPREAAETRAA